MAGLWPVCRAILCRHRTRPGVRGAAVRLAVWFPDQGHVAAELERRRAGIAQRPAARRAADRGWCSSFGCRPPEWRWIGWRCGRRRACLEGHNVGQFRHRQSSWRWGWGWRCQAGPFDRGFPARQIEAVRLADNGVLRDAKAATDFRGRMSFIPELAQLGDRIVVPITVLARGSHRGLLPLFSPPRPLLRVGRRRAGQGRRLAPGPTLARRGAGWHLPASAVSLDLRNGV
jgi:hypothetical protein